MESLRRELGGAILGCLRIARHVDIADDLDGFIEAFRRVQIEGEDPLPRWFSFRDRHGYLWFDEYPQPGSVATRVKNGHVFAVIAMHELSLVGPGEGFETFARAGATTIEAYVHAFRFRGKISEYALGAPGHPDYAPARAMGQLYELYLMTGAPKFLRFADLFVADADEHIKPHQRQTMARKRASAIAAREGTPPA